jgi:putative transposase
MGRAARENAAFPAGRIRDELVIETIFYDLDRIGAPSARWTAAYTAAPPLGARLSHPFAGTFTATSDRTRNHDQVRRSQVAPPALVEQSQPATLTPTG